MANSVCRQEASALQASASAGLIIVASAGTGVFRQLMTDGRHTLLSDEPVAVCGDDAGPGPYELLLMALGSCTSMTINLYAARKKWLLEQVIVRLRHDRVHVDDCANCEKSEVMLSCIEKSVELIGSLDEVQRARLHEIGDRCPVHRTLTSKIEIRSTLVPAST
jgi:putative redox protein